MNNIIDISGLSKEYSGKKVVEVGHMEHRKAHRRDKKLENGSAIRSDCDLFALDNASVISNGPDCV